MEIIILASGSKGNAMNIKSNNSNILIDIGISYQVLKSKLKENMVDIKSIKHLFITHEHSDHIKGLQVFLKYHGDVTVYLSLGTYESLDTKTKELLINYVILKSDNTYEILNFKFETYGLSHDAKEPLGFVISSNNKKVVIATDTGYIDESYFDLLSNADFYLLEANHEPSLLMDSSRPYYLKQRIISEKGHLSNHEASYLIDKFIPDDKKAVWAVAHISEDCNNLHLIEKSIVRIIKDPTKVDVLFTSQTTSKVVKIWLRL